jgi:hypothetical protein
MFEFRRGNHIVFRDCTFDSKSLVNIAGAASTRLQKLPAHALIGFESCTGISRAQISYSGALTPQDGIARVYSHGSSYELMSTLFEAEPVARDFDLNWRDGAASAATAFATPRKTFHLARVVAPSAKVQGGSGAMTFVLPEGAMLTAIYLRKSGTSAGAGHSVRLVAAGQSASKPLVASDWQPMDREIEARAVYDPLSGPVLTGGQQRISCGLESREGSSLGLSAKIECVVEYI